MATATVAVVVAVVVSVSGGSSGGSSGRGGSRSGGNSRPTAVQMVPSAQRIDQYKREVDVSTYNLSWGGRVTRPVMSGRNNGHQNGNSIAADANGSGFLSLKEMRKAVAMAGVMLEQEELSMLMTMYDESNDGKVSFEEFGKAMIKQRNANPLAHQHIVPGTEVKLDGRIIPQKAPSKPALPVPKPKPGLHD